MINPIRIHDFSSPELDVYARLSESQLLHYYEPHGGLFIAESPKVISRALDAGCEPVSFLLEPKHIEGEARDILARCPGVPVYTAELDILTKLTGFSLTRGALCCMKRPPLPDMDTLCRGNHRIAILENVMNPTNVGAIFRSAAAMHMDAVLLTPGCADPLYRRASRVSMGTVFQIPWTYITPETCRSLMLHQEASADSERIEICCNTSGAESFSRISCNTCEAESFSHISDHTKQNHFSNDDSHFLRNTSPVWPTLAISGLHKLGYRTAALALKENSVSIDDPVLMAEERLALILGTEGDGLAADTIADCDYTVLIPMSHQVDSLNVAAASAVAFWQLRYRSF